MSGQRFARWAEITHPTWAGWVQKRRKEASPTLLPKIRQKRKGHVRWLKAGVTNKAPVAESAPSGAMGIIVRGPGGVRIEITEAKQVSLAVQLLRELHGKGRC